MRILTFVVLLLISLSSTASAENLVSDYQAKITQLRFENKLPEAASYINKLAFLYWEQGQSEKAIEAFEQSIALNIEIDNKNAIKGIYSNIGMIYSDMGQPESSLVFFRKSLLLSRTLSNKQDVGTNLINIAVALKTLDRYDEAIDNLTEALILVSELKNKKLIRTCYGELAELYEKLGDSAKSMEYFSLYASFQKDIQKEEIEKEKQQTKKQIVQMKQTTNSAIKAKEKTQGQLVEAQDSLKRSEEIIVENKLRLEVQDLAIKKQKAELKNKRLLVFIFIILSLLLLIVALFILRGFRQKQKHNEVLEKHNELIKQKNLKINQSINYAKNIQGAILPEADLLTKMFPKSFVLFKPRDVVSGDFYWYNEVICNKTKTKKKIITAIDCTGHGVPGAFMSMLGMSFLQEIVDEKNILEPVQILEEMHKMVKIALRQEDTGNTDGMDMAVCVFDESKRELTFAGAVNPLVYIQNNEIKVLKGDFFGIGGQMKGSERMFGQKTITINEPTTCYIFSDGFADQFGGEKGRKYFTKNFRSLLFDIHTKSMHEQAVILDETLEKWHGETYSRVDDVLVLGFIIE